MTEVGLRRGTFLTRMASSSAVTPSAGALCFFILTVYLLFRRLRSVARDSQPPRVTPGTVEA